MKKIEGDVAKGAAVATTIYDYAMWKIIKDLNWGEISHSEPKPYDMLKKKILMNYSCEEIVRLRGFVRTKFRDMYYAIDKYEKDNNVRCGDYGDGDGDSFSDYGDGDSFSDMIHHIIGMGEDVYNSILNDPHLLNSGHEANNYVESFSYSLPYDSDLDLLNPEYHRKRAIDALERLNETKSFIITDLVKKIRGVERDEPSLDEDIRFLLDKGIDVNAIRDMPVILEVEERLIAISRGHFELATDGFDEDKYNECSSLNSNFEFGALFSNIIHDVKKYSDAFQTRRKSTPRR